MKTEVYGNYPYLDKSSSCWKIFLLTGRETKYCHTGRKEFKDFPEYKEELEKFHKELACLQQEELEKEERRNGNGRLSARQSSMTATTEDGLLLLGWSNILLHLEGGGTLKSATYGGLPLHTSLLSIEATREIENHFQENKALCALLGE